MNTRILFIGIGTAAGLAVSSAQTGAADLKGKANILRAPIGGVMKGEPSPVAPTYRFTIDSIVITKTRSLHEDTDIVALQVTPTGAAAKRNTVGIGDVNDGTHPVGLSIDMAAQPSMPIGFKYSVMNSGYDWGTGIALKTIGDQILQGSVDLGFLLVGDCDGLVAKGTHLFNAAQLATGQSFSGQDYTPGTDSSYGCGSNSKYYVNWSVRKL